MSKAAPQQPAGRMIAIASGKGGVGKTFIAASLAHAFARRDERVLLFDGDLGMANVDVQLGLDPSRDLSAVASGESTLEAAVSPAFGGAGEGGFDVIAGRSGSGALAGLSRDEATSIAASLSALSLGYDRVVMDLAAGADPALMRLAMAADDILVVLLDEPTALTDAYAFIKMLRLRDDSAQPLVTVNMADGYNEAKIAYQGFAKTCDSFLGFRPVFAGPIRRDQEAKAAIRAQQPLFSRAANGPAATDITRLAAHLSGSAAVKAA